MADEIINNQQNQPVAGGGAPATPAGTENLNVGGTTTSTSTTTATGIGVADTANRNQAQATYPNGINNEYLNNYMQALGGGVDHSGDINQMYQGLLDSNLAQLQAANQINQNNYEQNRQQLLDTYNQQRNANAVDYERNRYNLNQQIASNGLNVGTGSQAALALNNTYQQGQNALSAAQVKAENELNLTISNLNAQYQADVAAAIGENDYQKAAALYQDKLNREKQITQYYQMLTEEMNTRASYGDFEMMRQIYGNDAADTALRVWATQNPQAAYDQGQITADDFYNITGQYPRGYKGSGIGGGGYGSQSETYRVDPVTGQVYVYSGQNYWRPVDDNLNPVSGATHKSGDIHGDSGLVNWKPNE